MKQYGFDYFKLLLALLLLLLSESTYLVAATEWLIDCLRFRVCVCGAYREVVLYNTIDETEQFAVCCVLFEFHIVCAVICSRELLNKERNQELLCAVGNI